MANKADRSGVPQKTVRQAVAKSSLFLLIQIKFDEWRKQRENRRKTARSAKTRAALVLGVPPKAPVAPKPKAKTPSPATSKSRTLAFLLGALFLLVLAAVILSVAYILTNPQGGREGVSSGLPTPTPTAFALGALTAEVGSEAASPTPEAGTAYQLRVETQRLVSAASGTWGPIAEIGIYLSPFQNGDSGPDFSRAGTLRQGTVLATTTDGVMVALTTFTAPTGLYWVAVDETTLPSGCAVWVPALGSDAEDGIALSRWKIVGITRHGDYNTAVVKFQIVCGVAPRSEVTSPTATSPSSSPTPSVPPPTGTPVPTGTPTTPPPTPTDSCGPDCLEPWTPVPTPTEYPPEVPTPTPVR